MQTRSFFRVFRGFLTLVIVGTIGMTAQLVFTVVTWRSSSARTTGFYRSTLTSSSR